MMMMVFLAFLGVFGLLLLLVLMLCRGRCGSWSLLCSRSRGFYWPFVFGRSRAWGFHR